MRARMGTGMAPEAGQARPMTGVTAAGFSSVMRGHKFDPLNQAAASGHSATSSLEKTEETPEMLIKRMEKKVNRLVEESAHASAMGDYQTALEKAKEAGRRERMLCKQREQASLAEQLNLDLTYCVLFNLANQYEANEQYSEALNTYLLIVKNKMFNNGSRLRVNMGNIYTAQKKYPQAIKMYRMALDQIGEVHKSVRLKILQNIGSVFVKMGQYADTITSFEHIMSEQPDFKTVMNLTLCYYAISDREKLKRCFCRMLQITSGAEDEDRYFPTMEDDPQQRLLIETIKNDRLRELERERKATADKTILTAAKLIAPVIETSFALGFDWCIEMVRSSVYVELASELEITKALTFLKLMNIPKAIETFKDCNRKDSKMAATAATNLSFILLLEKDLQQAEKFADSAVALDRYNPHALVNKGNVLYSRGDYEAAREFYQEALSVEATCSEALFNTGLVHKQMRRYGEAMECFVKLHNILRSSSQVIYHLADLSDKMGDTPQSIDWFLQLISLVPTDPHVLQRVG
ncbi:Intraflagellar transport protein 88 homolog [Geodia barretti]|nr:Intraflagellar transport protein 88 homolog [Geodia barretti]